MFWGKSNFIKGFGLAILCLVLSSCCIFKGSCSQDQNQTSLGKNVSLGNWEDMFSGDYFNCAKQKNQKYYCWGFHPLASPFDTPQRKPIEWKEDDYLELEITTEKSKELVANDKLKLLQNSGMKFTHIYSKQGYQCGLTPENALYCWGYYLNKKDSPKIESPQPIFLYMNLPMNNLKFKKLSLGLNHMCGLTVYDELYCWGDNTLGQLGLETPTQSDVPLEIKMQPK